MADSTNAERPGYTQSEKNVGKTLDSLFAAHPKGRILVATFASNVDRVQQIINSAYKHGRKVAVEGRSMVNIIATASELGYIKIPKNTLIETDQMRNVPDDQIVMITTGSQGETMEPYPGWQTAPTGRFPSNRQIPSCSVPARFREMRKMFQTL